MPNLRKRINRLRPTPESPYHKELPASPFIQHAWDHGTRSLVLACDNMLGFLSMMRGAVPTSFAPYSVLRSGVDGIGLSRWLFEPEIGPDERARRAYRAVIEDLIELGKAQAIDPDESIARANSAGHLRAIADEQASAHGVTPAPRDKSTYSALAVRYAPIVLDVNRSGAWGYAVLSAAAHGRAWAITLGIQSASEQRDGVRDFTLGPHHALVDAMAWLVLRALTWAVEDAEGYAGIKHDPIPR